MVWETAGSEKNHKKEEKVSTDVVTHTIVEQIPVQYFFSGVAGGYISISYDKESTKHKRILFCLALLALLVLALAASTIAFGVLHNRCRSNSVNPSGKHTMIDQHNGELNLVPTLTPSIDPNQAVKLPTDPNPIVGLPVTDPWIDNLDWSELAGVVEKCFKKKWWFTGGSYHSSSSGDSKPSSSPDESDEKDEEDSDERKSSSWKIDVDCLEREIKKLANRNN